MVTGRHMSRITKADGDIQGLGIDVLHMGGDQGSVRARRRLHPQESPRGV